MAGSKPRNERVEKAKLRVPKILTRVQNTSAPNFEVENIMYELKIRQIQNITDLSPLFVLQVFIVSYWIAMCIKGNIKVKG